MSRRQLSGEGVIERPKPLLSRRATDAVRVRGDIYFVATRFTQVHRILACRVAVKGLSDLADDLARISPVVGPS